MAITTRNFTVIKSDIEKIIFVKKIHKITRK